MHTVQVVVKKVMNVSGIVAFDPVGLQKLDQA